VGIRRGTRAGLLAVVCFVLSSCAWMHAEHSWILPPSPIPTPAVQAGPSGPDRTAPVPRHPVPEAGPVAMGPAPDAAPDPQVPASLLPVFAKELTVLLDPPAAERL